MSGRVEAWREVVVHADAGGIINELRTVEGRRVAAGDLLIGIDDRDTSLDLAASEAEWLRAQATYAVAYAHNSVDSGQPAAASSTAG
jgi:multidrug efflux pump subunit AcrA (membrane-fusion protein)